MTRNPVEVVQAILANPTSIESIRELAAEDVTYVSLNTENAELKQVLPWAGTSHGPQAIVDVFSNRSGGAWHFQSNPNGGEVTVGMEREA